MPLKRSFPLFTERLEIRGLESKDVTEDYIAGLNNIEYMRYSLQSLKVHTISSQLDYIKAFAESDDKILAIVLREQQRLVGTFTLRPQDLGKGVDLGIFIFPECSGNRFANEAWSALVHHLSRQFLWISGGCAKSNLPMISIMESANMTVEREVKNSISLFHGLEDGIFYRFDSASKESRV